MNIAAIGNSNLTLAVSDTGSMNAIDMAMLKKSLDAVETNGAMITHVNCNLRFHTRHLRLL